MIDPVYRKPEGTLENIQSQTPGLSTGVDSYKDIYGQDSKRDLPLLNSFSPLKVSVEKPATANLLQQQQNLNIEKAQVKKQNESLGLSNAKESVQSTNTSQTVGDNIVYYDDGVKTLDLKKLDDINKLPSDNKYNAAIRESKQFSQAALILDKQGLTAEQKTLALKRLGIDESTAKYYQVANDNTNLKTMYVMDQLKSATTPQELISGIATLRQQVNGQMIASNAVLDNLVNEGIISKQTATELKKYKLENGKLTSVKKASLKKGKKIKVSMKKPPKLKALKTTKIKLATTKKYKPVKFKVPKKLKVKKIAIRKSV
jgi:hypothetical protein